MSSVIWLLSSFAIMVVITTQLKVLHIKIEKMEELAIYLNQECSDEYTALPSLD